MFANCCTSFILVYFFVVMSCAQRGCSPLHFAVRRKNMASAIHLLGAGCLLDTTDMNGETPLHSAARDGLLPIVQTMCAYGCSVDVVNKVMKMLVLYFTLELT